MPELGETERDLARAVITYLVKRGWPQPYQEVKYRGSTADIVVDRDGHGWVVECKRTLSMAVFEQAYDWQHENRFVSIAVCAAKRNAHGRNFAKAMCRKFGIGLIEVDRHGYAREGIYPADQRRAKTAIGDILQSCRKEHLTWCEAGSTHGAFTAFKATIKGIKEFLAGNGPATLAVILANVKHHYKNPSSAKRSLGKWLQDPSVCPDFSYSKNPGQDVVYSLRGA